MVVLSDAAAAGAQSKSLQGIDRESRYPLRATGKCVYNYVMRRFNAKKVIVQMLRAFISRWGY
jgi:hypothetical protein